MSNVLLGSLPSVGVCQGLLAGTMEGHSEFNGPELVKTLLTMQADGGSPSAQCTPRLVGSPRQSCARSIIEAGKVNRATVIQPKLAVFVPPPHRYSLYGWQTTGRNGKGEAEVTSD